MTSSINKVMQRHLQQLKKEISLYKNETDLWTTAGDISNTAGNLCLHLCGNLQHFVGAVLGNTGYIRQREAEFSAMNISAIKLQEQIDATITTVSQTLDNLEPKSLSEDYPVKVFAESMTTEYFLIHLTSHLGYHLGQINYHRRILAAKN